MTKVHRLQAINKAILAIFVSMMSIAGTFAVSGQQGTAKSKQEPIIFKKPKGYEQSNFTDHKGKLMYASKKPAAMFVAYPAKGQDLDAFTDDLKRMVVRAFWYRQKDKVVVWNATSLPAHQGIESESGSLLTTSDDEMEVQLALWVRADSGVVYGYFGMRHKTNGDKDATFVDQAGAGVKELDEFARSIGGEKKKQ